MKKQNRILLRVLLGMIGSIVCLSNTFAIEITSPEKVLSVLLRDTTNNIDTTDSEETFITGETPNNYIWYSGKLWRAISIDTDDNSVKIVTQWNQTIISYNLISDAFFEGSYVEKWLNDGSKNGFLGNLYDYKNFIKENSTWDYSIIRSDSIGSKPTQENVVTDVVGLVDIYEYSKTATGTTYAKGYMNNQLSQWFLTPSAPSNVWYANAYSGNLTPKLPNDLLGVRPSVNLLSNVEIISGDGSSTNPYRLKNDLSLDSGSTLSSGKSGEYVKFNDALYRIVTTDGTNVKLVALKSIKKVAFDSSGSSIFNPEVTTNIAYYLNNDWYNTLSDTDKSMMTDSKYYLGSVTLGNEYTGSLSEDVNPSVTAKVGLIRYGELMSGQFDINGNNTINLTLTPTMQGYIVDLYASGAGSQTTATNSLQILPTITLNNNAIVKSGTGLSNDPYILPTAEDFKKVTYIYTSTDNPTDALLPQEETTIVGIKYVAKTVETEEAYSFDGWYTDENLTTKYVDETEITDNLSLYGKWTKNDQQTSDENNNSDSNIDNPSTSDNIVIRILLTVGSGLILSITIIKLLKTKNKKNKIKN